MKNFSEIGRSCGTDKISHHRYDRFYPRFLEELRNREFSMLEIGTDRNYSMNLWKEYFPLAKIYGMDIGNEYQDGRCKIFKGDQSKEEDLNYIIDQIGDCDFIIDDGSHHPHHQFTTFVNLFENLLSPGGIYIIEDVECNYWRPDSKIYGYEIGHFNFMEILKQYPDLINSEFSGKRNPLKISSITFGHNCVILTKMTESELNLLQREYRFKENL